MRDILTRKEIERQDLVDNAIMDMLRTINPSAKKINWDINKIGLVRDTISDLFVKDLKVSTEKKFYPFS